MNTTEVKTTASDEGLMTVEQVAAYLSLCRTTVYGMLNRGDLPSVRIGTARRVPRQAVRELATRGLERKGERAEASGASTPGRVQGCRGPSAPEIP